MASTSVDLESNVEIEKRLGRIEHQLEGVAALAAVQGNALFGFQGQREADEIDLRELWDVIWRGKWIIIAVTFLFAVASVLYALSLPNIYKSEALLAPAEESSGGGLAGMAGRLGGLASLAGVNLGGGGSDKTTIAIEVLKSRGFISKFVQQHDLLVPLMAAVGWDRGRSMLIVDGDVYDEVNKKWIRDPKPPRGVEPSSQEAYEQFIKIMIVSKDDETGLVNLSVEHYSPDIAKAWVGMLILDINEEIKRRDVTEAKESIKYLSDQLGKISVADMKAVFYELIEEQTKTMMFAEVREEYVFKTIDAAMAPELKSKPNRGGLCVLGVFLGGFVGLIFVLFRHFLVKE